MKRFYIFTAVLSLTACADVYQQPYAVAQPPTVTQIQGQCFSGFKAFNEQANCIISTISSNGFPPDAGIQEYLLLIESLKEKVAHKTLSENDARLKLAGKLSELRALQQSQEAIQQQLEYQRAAQNAEILRQYNANIIKPTPYQPVIRPRIETNCQASGNQVNCTTR